MGRFAGIRNGIVSAIFEAVDLPTALTVDPTAVAMPDNAGLGSSFDGSNFGPPNVSVRLLKRADFWFRFLLAERKAIRASADQNVSDFIELVKLMEMVSLDDPFIIQACNYAEAHALIAAGRAAQILS